MLDMNEEREGDGGFWPLVLLFLLSLWLLPVMISSVPTETECQMSPMPLLVEVPEEDEEGETSMR